MRKLSVVLFLIVSFGCTAKQPLEQNTQDFVPGEDYSPGALIIKFTQSAVEYEDFQLTVKADIVFTGLRSLDALNFNYRPKSFEFYWLDSSSVSEPEQLRDYIFQFVSDADMVKMASVYSDNEFIHDAHPNWLLSLIE